MSLIDAIPFNWKFSYKNYVGSYNKKLNEAKGKIIVGEMIDDVNCLKIKCYCIPNYDTKT